MPLQITNQYWVVGDTNPTTQVWSGPIGAMVANNIAAFTTWLNANDGSADVVPGANVIGTANNGAGLIRVQTIASGTNSMQTGQVVNFVGNNSGAAGAKAVTVIDSTHFDIQGSTFSVADTSGVIWSATHIDTATNLYQVINAYNVTLWQAARFLGTNTFSGNADITLVNPMLDVQNAQFSTSGATRKIILPQMNVFGSIPIGMPVFILNNSAAVPNNVLVRVFAADGVTQVGQNLPFGLAMVVTLAANDTTNGTFTAGLRTLTNDNSAAWNVPRGGTGNQTLTSHGVIIGQGTSPVSVTAAMTDGQLLIGQTGADPAPQTISGGATITNAGVVTLGNPGASTLGGVKSLASASHKWINQIATDGTPSATQPASTDLSDLPIPVASGGTAYAGGAWTLYTATLAPNSGTFTQGSNQSAYLQIGKIVLFMINETLTITSGAPTSILITLPVAVKRATRIVGAETATVGDVIQFGLAAGQTQGLIRKYDNTVWAPTSGDQYTFIGSYEAA